jgi:peptidoglycan/LPS O-acetylase OafA/YrhL
MATVCHVIAKHSYGIYLCHVPVLWFCFAKLAHLPAIIQWTTLALLMVVIPVASFRLVEAPLIAIGRRLTQKEGKVVSTTPLDRLCHPFSPAERLPD